MNYDKLNINELDSLIEQLTNLRKQKFEEKFVRIGLYFEDGNMSYEIERKYGFNTFWRGNSGTIGTTYIDIPKNEDTESIIEEIKSKYKTL